MTAERILYIEDDDTLSSILKRFLTSKGYEVDIADSIKMAKIVMKNQNIDLILLDMMLPDGEGIDLCREIRKESYCPILYISCLSDAETKIKALEIGGDDYMTKPVDFNELLTRIRVNLRRAKQYDLGKTASNKECVPGFLVKTNTHEVWLTNEEGMEIEQIEVSPTEYSLLIMFMKQPNILFLYDEIYQRIWDADGIGDVRTVMVHVSNLRKKLGASGRDYIQTVRSAGYIFHIE